MNYFNYFTEIEEQFLRRRGSLTLLSTLDWALIESWREAGIPLAAVLRGIDDAFDRHRERSRRAPMRRINGLAYCSQAVLAAVEDMKEASLGAAAAPTSAPASGLEEERVAAHLEAGAALLESCAAGLGHAALAADALAAIAARLRALASGLRSAPAGAGIDGSAPDLEGLEATLTVLEQKMFAALQSALAEEEMLAFREQAGRDLAPYRGRMQAAQIRQVLEQYVHKRMLDHYRLSRLSLFYMSQS